MSVPAPTDFSPERDQTRAELEMPVAVVEFDTMEANVREFAAFARDRDVALRSHVKTHKNSALAHRQEALSGVDGIVCQALNEALVMARNGISDIYLSYLVISASKLDRLAALSESIDSFATTIDCPGNIEPLRTPGLATGLPSIRFWRSTSVSTESV